MIKPSRKIMNISVNFRKYWCHVHNSKRSGTQSIVGYTTTQSLLPMQKSAKNKVLFYGCISSML